MVAFNVSVEDSSPLITYLPLEAWKDLPSDDPLISSSSGRSLHTTQTQDAKAEVSFTGTGIAIYGVNIADYGDYSVTVDGEDISSHSAAGINNSKKVLGSTYGLPNGLHTATLVCSGSKTINIDYLDVIHEGAGSSISTTVIDDSDTRVLYQPSSSWQTNNATNEGFMNNTLHFSSTNGSSASLTFTGQAIAVYGTVSNDRSNLLVSLNGQTQQISVDDGPRLATSLHSGVLWYFTDALGPGEHFLSLTSDIQRGTGFIDVDAFVVYSFDGNAGNGNSTSTNDNK
ncbi:hypothetical protein L218DRAFT_346221 [Marasmius fiardii PR-910]|nr:hypothetical protein L218DRAFT_346221 [Marasmius fiardii PR-910]